MTTMKQCDLRWEPFKSYPYPSTYKGFQLVSKTTYELWGVTHLRFTNGQKELFVSGIFVVEAYKKMFDAIDDFYEKTSTIS